MTIKDGRPPNTPWASPYITVADVDKAADFYAKAFGFEAKNLVTGEDNTSWHGELYYQGQLLMLGKEGAYGSLAKTPRHSAVPSPINLYLYCQDVDVFHETAVKAGAISLSSPENAFWGDRMCRLEDLDGYAWCVATCLT